MDHLNDLPAWLRNLFTQVKVSDITSAASNVTFVDLRNLLSEAKNKPLDADLVKKLFENARNTAGIEGSVGAIALVILILIFLFPMTALAPFLSALGFTQVGPAAASVAAWFQSVWGVNALFSLLQSARMGGYGASILTTLVRRVCLSGVAAKVGGSWGTWGWGNGTAT